MQIAYSIGSVVSPVVRLVKGGFDVAVSKLASDNRFNLVSSPSLRVSSGESARVVVGQDVPVLGAVTVPANGAPVQRGPKRPPRFFGSGAIEKGGERFRQRISAASRTTPVVILISRSDQSSIVFDSGFSALPAIKSLSVLSAAVNSCS